MSASGYRWSPRTHLDRDGTALCGAQQAKHDLQAVRGAANDGQQVVAGTESETAVEEDTQALDDVRRTLGEAGDGTFLDFAVLAEGLTEEDAGGELRLGTVSMYMGTYRGAPSATSTGTVGKTCSCRRVAPCPTGCT